MRNLYNSLKIHNFVVLNNLYLAQHSTSQHRTSKQIKAHNRTAHN